MNPSVDTGLEALTFEPLPLGSVRPRGWLRRQLQIQADGLSGHLDEFWPDLADNQWLGGERGGWERGPYYVDGLLPLAHLLEDEELQSKARKWVDGFLDSQRDDGWIGPIEAASHQGSSYDPWPRYVVLKVLRQHYEVSGDDAVLEAMVSFCKRLATLLETEPLESWAKFRWQDLVVTVQWLYERTGEKTLLDLSETAIKQGYDWADHYGTINGFAHTDPAPEWSQGAHVVNHAMSVKAPGVAYRRSGDDADRKTAHRTLDILDRYHGQLSGVFTGDECLAGPDPTRGTELCAVVEFMYSLEQLVATFGEVRFADRLERVAYNALPATFTRDMWAHQYDQQANQVCCNVAPREWTNGPDANVFGLEPNFGCCTANMHQGWPKFVEHLWMGTEDGLAAVAYGPSIVETTVGGTDVIVEEATDYPFEDEVEVTVDPAEPLEFELTLRVPVWADETRFSLPDGETRSPERGQFVSIDRQWEAGDTVSLTLIPELEAPRRFQGAVGLRRGPLVFSRPIEAETVRIGEDAPYGDRELYPDEPWNDGLLIETDAPAETTEMSRRTPGETPFSRDPPPMELIVDSGQVPEWRLDGNDAGGIPHSPTPAPDSLESLTLVPYGCTNLRVTEFPLLSAGTGGDEEP